MSTIAWQFEHSLAFPLFGIWMKTDLFQSHRHCCAFQICWHVEWSILIASSSRIWNNSARIPSLPLALFLVMLPKAHFVRMHITGGFLCAVLDLSGNLWPLLIPEYSGIRRRGSLSPGWGIQAFPLLVSHHGDKYPLLSLIGIALCFLSLEF